MKGDQYDDLERLALQSTGAAPLMPLAGRSLAARLQPAKPATGKQTGTIATAQSLLTQHGFSPGHPPNGTLTPGTQNAIAAFQKKNGLPSSGTLDGPTQAALKAPPLPSRMGPGRTNTLRGGVIRVSNQAGQAGSPPAVSASGANASPGGLFSTGGTPVRSAPSSGGGASATSSRVSRSSGSARGAASSPQPTAPKARTNQGQAMYESAGKRVPVTFSSNGTVAANGGTQDIVVTPQLAFRGEAIAVDATTAAFFSIRQIKIGVTPQNAGGNGDIPCTLFPATQTQAVAFEMDLCNAGTQITMTVVNYDTAVHAFVGTIWGHEIEQVSQ